jgi:hypothetical protein
MFVLTFSIMVTVGLCTAAIARRLKLEQMAAGAVPLLAAALLLFAPPHDFGKDRPVTDIYRRVRPFTPQLEDGATWPVPGNVTELCHYLMRFGRPCRLLDYWSTVRPQALASGSLPSVLRDRRVELLYADSAILADPVAQPLFRDAAAAGWQTVAGQDREWIILRAGLPLEPASALDQARHLPGEPQLQLHEAAKDSAQQSGKKPSIP